MNKEQILACKMPGDLFSAPDKVEEEYVVLAKQWHPDKGGSNEVMSAINAMHESAKIMIKLGRWDVSNKRFIELSDGKSLKINFLKENDFQIGMEYICASACVYVLNKDESATIPGFPTFEYPAGREEEFERYIPKLVASHRSKNNEVILAVYKRPHMFCLSDVLEYHGGKIPPKHVAWILSSLYNLCCFFKYNGIVHNGISLDTYFVSPSKHIGALLGGWWFHGKEGESMVRVPMPTHMVMKSSVKVRKKNDYSTDLECVKLIGRQLLGDAGGSALIRGLDKSTPWQMINFVRTPSSDDPMIDYGLWSKVLRDCFGERKFIEMDVKSEEIYPSI